LSLDLRVERDSGVETTRIDKEADLCEADGELLALCHLLPEVARRLGRIGESIEVELGKGPMTVNGEEGEARAFVLGWSELKVGVAKDEGEEVELDVAARKGVAVIQLGVGSLRLLMQAGVRHGTP
jgi:hypothetical protein